MQETLGCIMPPQVEAKALGELVSHKLPRLAAHLAALDADVSLLVCLCRCSAP